MKIVSLLPSATEIICSLGLHDQLVGVTHECDYPAAVRSLPKVTHTRIPAQATSAQIDRLVRDRLQSTRALYTLDLPLLMRLQPDLIVTQALCDVCAVPAEEVRAAVRALPAAPRVVNLEPQSLADVFGAIRHVAVAAEVEERAAEVVASLQDRVAAVHSRVASAEIVRPRVALLEWLDPPFSCGHWNPELVRLAGGVDGLGRAGLPSRTLLWEEVMDWQPQVVFIACCGLDVQRTLQDLPHVQSVPGWLDLPAVRAGRVFVSDGSQYFNRPGPRLVDSLEILAHAIDPQLHPLPPALPAATRVASNFRHARGVACSLLLALLLALACSGCSAPKPPAAEPDQPPVAVSPVLTTFADQLGCVFTSVAAAPVESAQAELISVPDFPGRWAIWGASGRDHRGHLWFGVSAQGVQPPSAHLFEFDPEAGTMTDRGGVVEALQQSGLLKSGEGQMKLHSKIVQGSDGHLYFSSYDEQGEATDGSRLPTWGGHLWRLRLPENRWEHLFAAPEALIAVAGAGRWIYALGYFNHVLYQYDCQTGKHQSQTVGSVGGHISRNFFCDIRGHAYVPRLRRAGPTMLTSLVEIDTKLVEQGETRFGNYTQTADDSSHGITGVQPLADGTIVFVTDQGFLYRVTPLDLLPAKVEPLGWFHPAGQTMVESLFTSDGKTHVLGYCWRATADGPRSEWLVFDLESRTGAAVPLELPAFDGQPITNPLLYGSMTRDQQGRCYLVGVFNRGTDFPLIVRVAGGSPQ